MYAPTPSWCETETNKQSIIMVDDHPTQWRNIQLNRDSVKRDDTQLTYDYSNGGRVVQKA